MTLREWLTGKRYEREPCGACGERRVRVDRLEHSQHTIDLFSDKTRTERTQEPDGTQVTVERRRREPYGTAPFPISRPISKCEACSAERAGEWSGNPISGVEWSESNGFRKHKPLPR